MARFYGELRDRKSVCNAAECEVMAVHDDRFPGLCLLCGKHWDEKFSGVDVVLAGFLERDPCALYVVGTCQAQVIEPGKLLSFRALPEVPRESIVGSLPEQSEAKP